MAANWHRDRGLAEKNRVVLHAAKMAFWQVYNIVIKYNCIYLSELWCFGVLDQVNNLAF